MGFVYPFRPLLSLHTYRTEGILSQERLLNTRPSMACIKPKRPWHHLGSGSPDEPSNMGGEDGEGGCLKVGCKLDTY